MAIEITNDCVGCPTEMGCIGNSCPYRNVTHYTCDKCGIEHTLYEYDGKQLCGDCLLELVPKVKCDDYGICAECGDEAKLYEYEGKELCDYCLLEAVPIVEGSDCYHKHF